MILSLFYPDTELPFLEGTGFGPSIAPDSLKYSVRWGTLMSGGKFQKSSEHAKMRT